MNFATLKSELQARLADDEYNAIARIIGSDEAGLPQAELQTIDTGTVVTIEGAHKCEEGDIVILRGCVSGMERVSPKAVEVLPPDSEYATALGRIAPGGDSGKGRQVVEVIEAGGALHVEDPKSVIGTCLEMLKEAEGVMVRGIDTQGIAICAFIRPALSQRADASPDEIIGSFANQMTKVVGLNERVLGQEFVRIVESSRDVVWNVIPMRFGELSDDDSRAAPYRFHATSRGTGFKPGVAILEKNGEIVDFIETRGSERPVFSPYVAAGGAAPALDSLNKLMGEEAASRLIENEEADIAAAFPQAKRGRRAGGGVKRRRMTSAAAEKPAEAPTETQKKSKREVNLSETGASAEVTKDESVVAPEEPAAPGSSEAETRAEEGDFEIDLELEEIDEERLEALADGFDEQPTP